jgi:hypothetical protein
MLQSFVPPLHLPRARIEPIRSTTEALGIVSLAITRPLREELVIITCDRLRTGHSLAVFDVRSNPDELAHDVVGFVASSPVATGVIAAHVRPTITSSAHDATEQTLTACLARAGLTLLNFFTVQHGEVSVTRQ